MPLLILGRRRAASGGSLTHTSTVALRGQMVPLAWRSTVRLGQLRVPLSHASTVGLRTARVRLSHTSVVARRTSSSPFLGGAVSAGQGRVPVGWAVSCRLGRAVRATLQHSGARISLTMTLRSAAPVPSSGETLPVFASLGDAPPLALNLTLDEGQREVVYRKDSVETTIRAYHAAAERAHAFSLPELVPWAGKDPLELGIGSAPPLPPQSLGVLDLLQRGFAAAGVPFALVGEDVFGGETWLEGVRDTTTQGRSPVDLCQPYLAAGYRLLVQGAGLVLMAPGATLGTGAAWSPCHLDTRTVREEAAHVPSRLELTAADAHVTKPGPTLPVGGKGLGAGGQDQGEPDDPTPNDPEPERSQSWINRVPGPDGALTVSAGYVRDGKPLETQEVSFGRVVVREPGEDDEEVVRVFEGVLLSDTKTTYTYHPRAPQALVRQVTSKKSYGYALATRTRFVTVAGRLLYLNATAGDLVADEAEVVTQVWRNTGPYAGYLNTRHAFTKRLVSVQQENPEGEPQERGPLLPRDYVAEGTSETYRWHGDVWGRYVQQYGGAVVPLYDAETQEPITLATRTGSRVWAEVMQNEPPKVSWPIDGEPKPRDPEEVERENPDPESEDELDTTTPPDEDTVTLPRRWTAVVAGGRGDTLIAGFPMVSRRSTLGRIAELLGQANGPRTVTELRLSRPHAVLPGAALNGGAVSSLTVETEGEHGSATITTVQVRPAAVTEVPQPPPQVAVVTNVGSRSATIAALRGAVGNRGVWSFASVPLGKSWRVGQEISLSGRRRE